MKLEWDFSASMSLMLNNLHAFGHKVHKVCIFYNGDRAERMRVCVSALAQYHIQAFYFISCSVRTENDFFFSLFPSLLFLFLFYPFFLLLLHLCLICSTAKQSAFRAIFSPLHFYDVSHPPPQHHHHHHRRLSLACRITFSKLPWTITSWLKCCTIFFPPIM